MKKDFHSVSGPLKDLMKKYNLEKSYAEYEIKKVENHFKKPIGRSCRS